MDEIQTCPRRMNEYGPWEYKENLDKWEYKRWGKKAYWPDAYLKPRTCSFCGGIHPVDALDLIDQGWEVEKTTKAYKAYLHPPGYLSALAQPLMQQRVGDPPADGIATPVPCVKLYTHHFSREQIDRLNEMLQR